MKKGAIILTITIIIVIIIFLAYLGRHKIKRIFMGSAQTALTQPVTTPKINPSTATKTVTNNIVVIKTTPSKGSYLTDPKGMTLYIFDKDTKGVSNCYNSCEAIWPIYAATSNTTSNLPVNITIIKRTDGSIQYAWKGMPLYYYSKDTKPGDVLGDGIGNIWHIARP